MDITSCAICSHSLHSEFVSYQGHTMSFFSSGSINKVHVSIMKNILILRSHHYFLSLPPPDLSLSPLSPSPPLPFLLLPLSLSLPLTLSLLFFSLLYIFHCLCFVSRGRQHVSVRRCKEDCSHNRFSAEIEERKCSRANEKQIFS